MKNIILTSVSILFAISFFSCVKPTSPNANASKPGTLKVFFNTQANGSALELGKSPSYSNNLGQKFSVNILKYYISQIRLKNDKGTEVDLGNFTLINEDIDAPSRILISSNFPAGNYTSVTFNFGLDKITNALPLASADLDHSYGMWWGEAKYLFLKHEGDFITATSNKKSLLYHVGTDDCYVPNITFPISGLSIDNNTKTVVINFNLDKIYDNIDFNQVSNMMSDPTIDKGIMGQITKNIASSFMFNSIQ